MGGERMIVGVGWGIGHDAVSAECAVDSVVVMTGGKYEGSADACPGDMA